MDRISFFGGIDIHVIELVFESYVFTFYKILKFYLHIIYTSVGDRYSYKNY